MKRFMLTAFTIILLFSSWNSLNARSWDDLDSGEHEIYGSEREEKFPVKALFMEIEEWQDHYSFMLLWMFKYTDYPRYKSTRLMPFYYGLDSKIDNRSLTVFPLPLPTWLERDGDEYTKFVLFPLYYSNVDSTESTRSLLWPLIWWGGYQSGDNTSSETYQLVIPLLWFHGNQDNTATNSGESLWINPLLISYSHWTSGKEDDYVWWAPVIPVLTYQSVDSNGGHRNFLMLLDYSWNTTDGRDTMERFWMLPLFLRNTGSEGYTYIAPPIYMHNRYYDGSYYVHLLPLFAAWNNINSETESTIITPLFGRHRVTDTKNGNDIYSNFFFPLLPLFYKSNENNGSWYCHLMPLFSAWHDTGTSTENQVITPLLSRRKVTVTDTGENIYSNLFFPIIPVFFTSSDSEEGTHINLAWLLDMRWNTEGSMKSFWFAPIVFHESRDWGYRVYLPIYVRPSGCSDEDGLSFSLFHYHRWSPDNDTVWAWLYYHNKNYGAASPGTDQRADERAIASYYRHLLPVYWSWQNSDSSGSVILPVIYNYKDKYTNLHVNLSGIAFKTFTGPLNPDLMIGLEKKDENWFLDTDISWLYDAFSVSWRVPVTGRDDDTAAAEGFTGPAERAVSIKKRGTDREDSVNYFGWDFLFGWMAYRHADTRYHFRLLPLSWFTWDAASEDKLYMFLPFYVSYYSEETKEGYFLAAPFYASQTGGDSYKKGLLINAFWWEYDAAADYREYTILWPFINWYGSPEKHGFRLFPLFWYKNWKEGPDTLSRSISPLHYSMSIKNAEDRYTYRKRLNPFYYMKESVSSDYSTYTVFAPLLPLFYYTSSRENGVNGLTINDSLSISPFHIYSAYHSANNNESYDSTTLMIPLLPLFYRSTEGNSTHWNLLGVLDRRTGTDYSRFFLLPFFYTSQRGDVKYRNILGIIDWETGGTSGGSSMFLPFYMREGGESKTLTLPILLSRFSSGKDWNSKFIAGTYWYTSPDHGHENILMLYDHELYMYGKKEYNEYDFLFTLAEVDVSPDIWEMRAAWGALFEYTKNRTGGGYDFDALLWFAGFDNDMGGFHSRLLPVWYYQSYSDNDWWLVVPPMLSYFSKDSSGDFDLALLGTLYYRNENVYAGEDRRMVLLGALYNEVKSPERKYYARGSLWGILWNYETEDETKFTKFTIFKGLYKYVNRNGESEHTVFWFL